MAARRALIALSLMVSATSIAISVTDPHSPATLLAGIAALALGVAVLAATWSR